MNEIDIFILDQIEHAGIKGMKWGVRRERRIERLARGGVKGGSAISRVRAAGRIGPVDFVRGRGVRGGSARKAVRVQGQLDRFKRGEASAVDIIKRYGSTHARDLVPVREKNVGKKTRVRGDIVGAAGVVLIGASIAARMLANKQVGRALVAR
jgi:hypothetical protein